MGCGYEVRKGDTTPLVFRMVSTADGHTPMPGLSPLPTVQLGKAGGALAAASGTVTEIGGGFYSIPNAGLLADPYGPLVLVAAATGARGAAVFPWVADAKDTDAAEKVWGENVGDMGTSYGEESAATAFYNAFNWNKSGGGPSGVRLVPAGLDAVVVEAGINARQSLALIGAATAGKAAGLATTTVTFYAMGASGTTTTRVAAVVDAAGNRTATTLTVPA